MRSVIPEEADIVDMDDHDGDLLAGMVVRPRFSVPFVSAANAAYSLAYFDAAAWASPPMRVSRRATVRTPQLHRARSRARVVDDLGRATSSPYELIEPLLPVADRADRQRFAAAQGAPVRARSGNTRTQH